MYACYIKYVYVHVRVHGFECVRHTLIIINDVHTISSFVLTLIISVGYGHLALSSCNYMFSS